VAYDVASHANRAQLTGRDVFIYQLGDHDPSGVDAWRDFRDKVTGFLGGPMGVEDLYFERLAVTPEQIDTMSLPTRPTKGTDPWNFGLAASWPWGHHATGAGSVILLSASQRSRSLTL
jgi:hypothetical protein